MKMIGVPISKAELDSFRNWCKQQKPPRAMGQQVRLMILKLTKRKEGK